MTATTATAAPAPPDQPSLIPAVAVVSVIEAAALAGCSDKTVKNDLAAGRYPNARKDDRGRWLIPAADLVAAKRLSPTQVHTAAERLSELAESRQVTALTTRLSSAEQRCAHAEAQLATSRALHAATQAHNAELNRALRTAQEQLSQALATIAAFSPRTAV